MTSNSELMYQCLRKRAKCPVDPCPFCRNEIHHGACVHCSNGQRKGTRAKCKNLVIYTVKPKPDVQKHLGVTP